MGEWMDVTYAEKCHMLFSEYVPSGKNKIKIKAMFISKIIVFLRVQHLLCLNTVSCNCTPWVLLPKTHIKLFSSYYEKLLEMRGYKHFHTRCKK